MEQLRTLQSGFSSLVKMPFRPVCVGLQVTGRVISSREFWDLLGTLSIFGIPTAVIMATLGPSSTADTAQDLTSIGFEHITQLFHNATGSF